MTEPIEQVVQRTRNRLRNFAPPLPADVARLCDEVSPELKPGAYECKWKAGIGEVWHGVLVVTQDGIRTVVCIEDGFSYSDSDDDMPHLTDIQPLVPQDDKPPAPRELMQRLQVFFEDHKPFADTEGSLAEYRDILAEVRRHTDPELKAKLRDIHDRIPDWKDYRKIRAELDVLIGELP